MSRPLVVDASCQPKRSLSLPAQALHIVGMAETHLNRPSRK